MLLETFLNSKKSTKWSAACSHHRFELQFVTLFLPAAKQRRSMDHVSPPSSSFLRLSYLHIDSTQLRLYTVTLQLCRRSNGARRDPNAGRRPAAGDHKGAQPPYQAVKGPQVAFQLVIRDTVIFTVCEAGRSTCGSCRGVRRRFQENQHSSFS